MFSQVPRTYLSILNNAAIWIVLILPLISNSSNPLFNLLGTVLIFFFHVIYLFSISILSFLIVYSKIVLFLLPLVADLFLYTLHLPLGRILFWYFRMSCFVCTVWPCPATFKIFLLLPIFLDLFPLVELSDLTIIEFLGTFISIGFLYVSLFLSGFSCCRRFFICPSSLISHPGFVFLFGFH